MSSTHNNNGERGITLTSLADLGSVLDLQSLPHAPERTADAGQRQEPSTDLGAPAAQDLATLLAQLASLSGGLENMARQDARAREQATLDLAHYETLLAERQDAERALAEARPLRAGAEQLAAEAFSDEARRLLSTLLSHGQPNSAVRNCWLNAPVPRTSWPAGPTWHALWRIGVG